MGARAGATVAKATVARATVAGATVGGAARGAHAGCSRQGTGAASTAATEPDQVQQLLTSALVLVEHSYVLTLNNNDFYSLPPLPPPLPLLLLASSHAVPTMLCYVIWVGQLHDIHCKAIYVPAILC